MSYYKKMKAIPKFQFGGVGPIFPAAVPVVPGLQKTKSRAAVTFTPVIPSMQPRNNSWDKGYANAQQILNEQRKEAATSKLRQEWQAGFDKWGTRKDAEKAAQADAKSKGDAALAKAILDAKNPRTNNPATSAEEAAEAVEIAKAIKDAEQLSKNKSAIPAKAVVATESAASKSAGTASKSAATANTGKQDSPQIMRIKRIQRSLHVKDDGIWGDKTAAAFEAAKRTQESLGFTGKDVDGIIGTKTKGALKVAEDMLQANAAAAKITRTPISDNQDAIRQPYSRSNREIRQDRREIRRDEREERRASRNVDEFNLRTGGIFYCPSK
jgi:hypothetical protein